MFSNGNPFINNFSKCLSDGKFDVSHFCWRPDLIAQTDVIIFHWPDNFFSIINAKTFIKTALKLAMLQLAQRLRSTRLIWVAHNARPHDSAPRPSALTLLFIRSLDGIIYLSRCSRDVIHDLYQLHQTVPELITAHGHYRNNSVTAPKPFPGLESEIRLSYFGQIRPYKGVDDLVMRVSEMLGKSVILTVIGRRNEEALASRIETISRSALNIHLDLRSTVIPHADLEAAIDDSHAVVLPYRDILNSGSALLALSRNRPILAPNIGSFPELQANVGADWVYLYEGELTTKVLEQFLAWMHARLPQSCCNLSAYDWAPIGRDLCCFIEHLCRRSTAERNIEGN